MVRLSGDPGAAVAALRSGVAALDPGASVDGIATMAKVGGGVAAAIGSTSMAMFDAVDDRLRRWIARHRRVFALTGAGCSTASGIPDYRDDQGEWKRRPPVMIQAFRTSDAVYQRYWARAYAGWTRFTAASPSVAHRAFAAWEAAGTLLQLVTQNVDGLHQRAGSRAVIDLHGRLDVVLCLGCGDRMQRSALQESLAAGNPRWMAEARSAPDG